MEPGGAARGRPASLGPADANGTGLDTATSSATAASARAAAAAAADGADQHEAASWRLKAIIYSEFDNTLGPAMRCQAPEG